MGDSAVALTGSAYYKLAGWQVMEGDKPHNINYGTYTLAELAKIAGGNQVILRPVYVYNGLWMVSSCVPRATMCVLPFLRLPMRMHWQ